eukprot:CAMPEP_0171075270 /NCGR_PEP_ID=MMETSP0766_2-20121228/12677_1 /TAXON_ID=439317 /ORGANISM="Gambierdiscus australes, Strain CAWD 149" /LENGTH=163 /DNA_ID=CAMNT_0011532129 /DNA_START=147 /DNA_END=634 /DNA_ORIENTATION=+
MRSSISYVSLHVGQETEAARLVHPPAQDAVGVEHVAAPDTPAELVLLNRLQTHYADRLARRQALHTIGGLPHQRSRWEGPLDQSLVNSATVEGRICAEDGIRDRWCRAAQLLAEATKPQKKAEMPREISTSARIGTQSIPKSGLAAPSGPSGHGDTLKSPVSA